MAVKQKHLKEKGGGGGVCLFVLKKNAKPQTTEE